MGNLNLRYKYSMDQLNKKTISALEERGVKLEDIADIVYDLQHEFYQGLTKQMCMESVEAVLRKREVIHAVLTGIEIDKACEKGLFEDPILSIIKSDEGLYGIDEILPLSIVNIYGSIGMTNFGFLDKEKTGVIRELDRAKDGSVNTFLDDIVAALAAAAASRLAHNRD
ncbi:MAG: phosphatidylglycerophosphatase A [Tissierellia bacterium]|nr:phosphatidylglycerophosphatase A [Tissierellia bacterium]